MSASEKQKQLQKSQSAVVSTAEAFYLVFRALPKKDRLAVARYVFEDEEILHSSGLAEIPNETTLKAFSEDKSAMLAFNSVDELRKDLLS